MLHVYHQLKYSPPNHSKTKQEPYKRAYLLENEGLGTNRSGDWAKGQKKRIRESEKERQD